MKSMIAGFFDFIKKALSDSNEASSSRIAGWCVVGSCCFCVIWCTVKTNKLPDNLDQLALFMAAAPYTANQIKEAIGKIRGTNSSAQSAEGGKA